MPDDLVSQAGTIGVRLNSGQVKQMEMYEDLLRTWAGRVRLVSRGDIDLLRDRHVLDSLSVVPHLPNGTSRVLDIGSGGGLPGIPVQIACPDLHVTLVEATRMKALFLADAKTQLNCENLRVEHARSEQLVGLESFKEGYDVVLAKGVAKLPKLWKLARPFLRPGGALYAFKGPGELAAERELAFGSGIAHEILLSNRNPGQPPRAFVVVVRQ
ncbi:MAG: 16S rRNA (guanine(527)-N(7))-methyltransferase RsmG [bacterium]|nr:16S rRNA (guanine(527)-N(7))-methyltransferase RsmG [bacterium]